MALQKSIYWHDYETFGSDPRRDRACQFAGIRTDEELNIIGEPLVIYCKPSPEFLPHPEACLITGISPQLAMEKGLNEAEFCAKIEKEFSQPGTCVAGYNSIRFDDEVTRHLLYRCFYDAYEREWKNGNSRWDIIDMLRLTHALRPEGIHWPQKDDGTASFRLEELTQANGIGHEAAHDALSDVIATIAVAKLVKEKQPKLYDFLYQRRQKKHILPMLDLSGQQILVHVSAMYPASQGCMALVVILAQHPQNSNGFVAYDLGHDPASWVNLSVEEIRQRIFTRKDNLPEGVERVALKTIHANKCPALAPLSVLTDEACQRYNIDLQMCQQNQAALLAEPGLSQKVAAVFAETPKIFDEDGNEQIETDPDLMLYSGGFFDSSDKSSMAKIRVIRPERLADYSPIFNDPRLDQMLLRYRARNFPETLSEEDKQRWDDDCRAHLFVTPWYAALTELEQTEKAENQPILAQLRSYADQLCLDLGLTP